MDSEPLANNLRMFIGGGDLTRYAPFGEKSAIYLTEGCKYLADQAGAYWLFDLICSHQPQCRKDSFCHDAQYWRINVNDDKSATVFCERDADNVLLKQDVLHTDFPLPEARVWVEIGVIGDRVAYIAMLPNEH